MRDGWLGPRLGDDDRAVLRHVLDLRPRGTAVEFGVGSGYTLRMIAARMPVIGFDSFEGLPTRWRNGYEKGEFACKPPVVANSRLVIGLFEDTLPGFAWPEQVGLCHLDADIYSSTATVLRHVPLEPGTICVLDEMHNYPGWRDHEYRAWTEHVERTGLKYSVIGHGPQQWAAEIL